MTNLTPGVDRDQSGVVRCALAQLEQINDRRRTVIFQTYIKIGNKSCMVIVDKLITTLGMKPVKHPNSYKVTWIDATSIEVQETRQIFIQFATYTDNCGVTYSLWMLVISFWDDHDCST